MLQNLIAYLIVALAFAWVIWHLFVPADVKKRMLPRNPNRPHDCADGCSDCPSACDTPLQPVVIRPTRTHRDR